MNDRRCHERFRLGGPVRLLADTPAGLVTATGEMVDLSVGGCGLRVYNREVAANLSGRVRVEILGEPVWLGVVTRWVRAQPSGWLVGCQFDRLTPEKQRAVYALLDEMRVVRV